MTTKEINALLEQVGWAPRQDRAVEDKLRAHHLSVAWGGKPTLQALESMLAEARKDERARVAEALDRHKADCSCGGVMDPGRFVRRLA